MTGVIRAAALLLVLTFVVSISFYPASTSQATRCIGTVYVNGTVGNDSYDGSSPVPGTGGVGPMQTIQAGVDIACSGGTVNIAAGVYSPTYAIEIVRSVNIVGISASSTILDGSAITHGDGEVIVVHDVNDGPVVLSAVTVQKGRWNGVYILRNASNVTINDCIIINNSSPEVGGGIEIDGIGGAVSINRCTISNNVVAPGTTALAGSDGPRQRTLGTIIGNEGYGGGIFSENCTLNLSLCTINNNMAIGDIDLLTGMGGGVYAWDNTTLNMTGCTVSGNLADWWGGGIFYFGSFMDTPSVATINNCNISNNLAVRAGGGMFTLASGFYTEYASNQSVIDQDNVPSDNRTYRQLGGFLLKMQALAKSHSANLSQYSIPVSVNNCTFANNESIYWGGGIASIASLYELNGCTLNGNSTGIFGGGLGTFISLGELVNCTVNGNTLTYPNVPAGFFNLNRLQSGSLSGRNLSAGMPLPSISNAGGGIGSIVSLTLLNCDTIAGNAAGSIDNDSYGGGIYESRVSVVEAVNTIVAGNTAFQASNGNCLNRGTMLSFGHNIDSQNSCGFTDATDQINTDPLLGLLQDNGGPTLTRAISANSPALDHGDNYYAPATDQRGATRPQGTACDIGAYERSTASANAYNGSGTLVFSTNNGEITGLVALSPSACSGTAPSLAFPFGIFSFSIIGITPGSTVQITIALPFALPQGTEYWKCDSSGNWLDLTSSITITNNTLVLSLTDGGTGDADHVANGVIVDPGGPAYIGLSNRTQGSSPYIAPAQSPVALSNIVVKSASISVSEVNPGEPVTVTAMLLNKGIANGASNIKVYINGELERSQGVTVNAGSTMPMSFTVSRSQPGTYAVYVGGTPAGSFTVNTYIDANIILVLSSVLVLLAIILGIIYSRRRRSY